MSRPPQSPKGAVTSTPEPKLGLALSGGGHRAAFFHVGVLAKLAELDLLRRVEVISTVSGGSIVGALFYLHVKNLLEEATDEEIGSMDAPYVEVVRAVEREYREAAASNVRGSAYSSLAGNLKMVKPTFTRTDRVAELYEQRFYGKAWGDRPRRNGRIAMRDLIIQPKGHDGTFVPDEHNPSRHARAPILLLEATTLNTGHNWRFEAMYMGEPPRQGTPDEAIRQDIDKNTIIERTRWDELPPACRDFPLGAAVASSACFPGGFPPMQVQGVIDGEVIELIDGGVHDNQGVEGLVDRGCTHMIISDGSGQMPDKVRPSTRLPAVLGRVVSIYGDAEREERLLSALQRGDSTAFLHLQTGLPAETRKPGQASTATPAPLETAEFGVHLEVQRALANVRTDLDAFCDLEAWALMGDGYRLAGQIVPSRQGVASLGKPEEIASWAFGDVAAQLGPAEPDPQFLKVLHVARERFLKPARMRRGGLVTALVLLAAAGAGAAVGLWFLLTPHGSALFIAGLATLACLGLYFGSDKPYVKPLAIGVFDLLAPLLLAIPLLAVAALQLGAGRLWRSAGSAPRAERAPEAVPVPEQ